MLKVSRRKNESFEGLFRRFNRRIQLSGRVLQARKIRYHDGGLSRNQRKASAIRRIQVTDDRAYKIKVGKLKEEKRRGRGRR